MPSPSVWCNGRFFIRFLQKRRGEIWKRDSLVADIEELETMDASEIYTTRLNAKEVIFPKENDTWRKKKLSKCD